MGKKRPFLDRVAALAVAGIPAVSLAQGAVPEGVAKRPDGSVVYPSAPAVPAAPAAKSALPEAAVKRPDGSVVYPSSEPVSGSRSDWWRQETDARAAERERYHLEAESARQQRSEQILRDREASQSSPARQIPPSQKNY